MEKLKVAILGPGGIGEFHAREFYNQGCNVSAILTTSKKSAKKTSEKLKDSYGIQAKPYWNIDELLLEELDIASICTSSKSHSEYTKKCLGKGLHVLCEKPFVFNNIYTNYNVAKELIDLAITKQKHLSVNTQLVSMLESLPKKPENIKSFYMYMEPNLQKKVDLMADIVPHMNSLLINLAGFEQINNLVFNSNNKGIKINFDYGSCAVEYDLGVNNQRPRKVKFNVDGEEFERIVDKDYNQYLKRGEETFEIKDPLKLSIKNFLDVIKNKSKPLINHSEILHNVKLQDFILGNYF